MAVLTQEHIFKSDQVVGSFHCGTLGDTMDFSRDGFSILSHRVSLQGDAGFI